MILCTDSGRKWAPDSESNPEILSKHLHHRYTSKLVNYNTTSQWSQHTRLLRTKCPISMKVMNLCIDSGRKWSLESESKSEIERKHLHHREMSKLVNYYTTYQWSQHTRLLRTKCPISMKLMNLCTDSGRKWSLESESKSEIERNHLHHRVMSNLVN